MVPGMKFTAAIGSQGSPRSLPATGGHPDHWAEARGTLTRGKVVCKLLQSARKNGYGCSLQVTLQ